MASFLEEYISDSQQQVPVRESAPSSIKACFGIECLVDQLWSTAVHPLFRLYLTPAAIFSGRGLDYGDDLLLELTSTIYSGDDVGP